MSSSFSGKHDSLCAFVLFVCPRRSFSTNPGWGSEVQVRAWNQVPMGGWFPGTQVSLGKQQSPCASHLSWGLLIPVIFCLNEGRKKLVGYSGPCGFLLTGKQGEISIKACHSSTGHSVHQVLKLIWGDFRALSFQGSWRVGGERRLPALGSSWAGRVGTACLPLSVPLRATGSRDCFLVASPQNQV